MAPARAAAAAAAAAGGTGATSPTAEEVLEAVRAADRTRLTAAVSAAAQQHLAAATAPRAKGTKKAMEAAAAAAAAQVVPLAVPLAQAALKALNEPELSAAAEECLCVCAAAALDALWAVRDVLEVKPLELHRQLYSLVRASSVFCIRLCSDGNGIAPSRVEAKRDVRDVRPFWKPASSLENASWFCHPPHHIIMTVPVKHGRFTRAKEQ